MSDSSWNEMLGEFRALGGVADNVRLGYGPFGRGIFPIDTTRPVSIRIPEDLLLPIEHAVIDGLADVGGRDGRLGLQVGDRSSQPQDLVVSARRQA